MKDKIKPKYNAAQNVGWMVKTAWKVRKRVLFICVAMAALEVLYNLTQLYVAPEILSCVERHAPVGELLGTIGLFTLALFLTMGLKEYLREISMYPLPEEKRMIRVYMDMKGTQLYISFTNFTAAKKLSKVGKGFKTSKGEGHGFGLLRIDDIVSRYDGYLSRNSEDGAFTTEILIPQA